MTNSKEMIALVSLAYNNPILLGNNLINAIQNGDRESAWYEINYNSNKTRNYGLQVRREYESRLFSLYGSSIDSNDIKKINQFLTSKQTAIQQYKQEIRNNDKDGRYPDSFINAPASINFLSIFQSNNAKEILAFKDILDNSLTNGFINSIDYAIFTKDITSYLSKNTPYIDANSNPSYQFSTTIYETASKLNTTVSKLEQSNPWLKSRSSDNLSTIFSNSSNKSLLVKDNTGKSYTYTYNSSSDTFENQTPIATADDAINFIANYQGSMSDLQNIQNAVKDAYENHGLSKEYYDAFMASFNTYVAVHTQNNNVTTQPTGNSTRIDKNAFYYYNNVNINLATKKILF